LSAIVFTSAHSLSEPRNASRVREIREGFILIGTSFDVVLDSEPVHGSGQGESMAEYKVYKIKNDQIFEPPVVFESPEEAAAIDRARQLVDGCDVQLWQGVRFVIGIKGRDNK
jgi:hypothetical protein